MRIKGKPLNEYKELKTKANYSITPTAAAGLTALATAKGISRSELLERIGRDEFVLMSRSECDRITEKMGIPCSELLHRIELGLLKVCEVES